MNSINWPASSVWVFIAQLGEHCSANAEATGSNPVEAPKILFFGLFSQLLKLRFTAMVTYSFHLYSRSSHHYIQWKRSPSIPEISLSVLLCSARKLIKYSKSVSKPNAVRVRRNAFMRDFPDFVEIYPVCQSSAVLSDISLILLSIGSYLELAIFREYSSSVAIVNVRFS